MKLLMAIILSTLLLPNFTTVVTAEESQKFTITNQDEAAQLEALRRGSYRSPSGSFTGGNRTGVGAGTRAPSSDVSRNPSVQPAPQIGSRWGGFLGGAAAGALIGHFMNPFGGMWYGGFGDGFSFVNLLIWAVIIYLGYKFFQKMFRRRL